MAKKITWSCPYCGEQRQVGEVPTDADANWYDWHMRKRRCLNFG